MKGSTAAARPKAALSAPVAVVAALAEELIPLRRRLPRKRTTRLRAGKVVAGCLGKAEVVLMATGAGAARARAGLTELLGSFEVQYVIGVGVAGALSPDLRVGWVVVASSVTNGAGQVPAPDSGLLEAARRLSDIRAGAILSHSQIAVDPVAKARLWHQSGRPPLLLVDLESASYARIAWQQGIRFLLVRAVSDGHDEALPLDFNRFRRPDGNLDRGRIWRHALRHPAVVPELMQLRERVQDCAERLADFVEELLAQ